MVEADYRDFTANSEKTGRGPRRLADGGHYWGFFHDREDERTENPVFVAWETAKALDERREPWASMPRLLQLSAIVGQYVDGRKPEHARTVTELTLAWFDSDMSDAEAVRTLASHPAQVAGMVLAGVPAEYATAVL